MITNREAFEIIERQKNANAVIAEVTIAAVIMGFFVWTAYQLTRDLKLKDLKSFLFQKKKTKTSKSAPAEVAPRQARTSTQTESALTVQNDDSLDFSEPSDSDRDDYDQVESSESEEEVEAKPAQKTFRSKSRIAGYVSNKAKAAHPAPTKTTPRPGYDICKKNIVVGKLTVNPKLWSLLDTEQTTVLENLCKNAHVLEGCTRKRTGLIFLNRVKDKIKYKNQLGIHRIKLKNCTKNYRFFARHTPGAPKNEFEVNGIRYKHKKNSPIMTV